MTKQDVINNGVLTFAKTAGLQAAINAQDKLASRIYVDNELIGKQDTLTAGTNITISGNTIFSTSNSSINPPYFYVSTSSDLSYVKMSTKIKWHSVKLNNYNNAYN